MGRLLACLLVLAGVTACDIIGGSPPTVVPRATPNIPATIEAAKQTGARNALAAQIAATIGAPTATLAPTLTPDINAIIEQAVQATIAAQATPIPEPTPTPVPTPKPAPTVAAVSPEPTQFLTPTLFTIWGQAFLNGSYAAEGTVVKAWIGASIWETTVGYATDGNWALLIPSRQVNSTTPGGLEGDTIRFTIDGLDADETATWETAGIVEEFTLHSSN